MIFSWARSVVFESQHHSLPPSIEEKEALLKDSLIRPGRFGRCGELDHLLCRTRGRGRPIASRYARRPRRHCPRTGLDVLQSSHRHRSQSPQEPLSMLQLSQPTSLSPRLQSGLSISAHSPSQVRVLRRQPTFLCIIPVWICQTSITLNARSVSVPSCDSLRRLAGESGCLRMRGFSAVLASIRGRRSERIPWVLCCPISGRCT